jgi:hypothetical protein
MKRVMTMVGAAFAGVLTVITPVIALSTGPAAADQVAVPICPGGDVTSVSGAFHNLTISGNDYVDSSATLTVSGNLSIAPGACLDAFSLAKVHVGGNINVGPGATLGLGCSPGALGPPFTQPPCNGQTTTDTVGGNIIGNQPWSMYLTANSIGGNVISNGGGPGLASDSFVNFPIKENAIHGNLSVQGWQGGWSGALRNKVGGNLIFSNNVSAVDPDSNEVVTNIVGGNLICMGNSPAIQFGDSGGAPNTVAGHKLGQCTAV